MHKNGDKLLIMLLKICIKMNIMNKTIIIVKALIKKCLKINLKLDQLIKNSIKTKINSLNKNSQK